MASSLESSTSQDHDAENGRPSGWVKLGAVAAASALAGGLAAAWWYRKTITKLHQAEESASNPQFGIAEPDSSDEV
jgi:hypothetical protein